MPESLQRPDIKWYFIVNDCCRGPVDSSTFRSLLNQGKIGPDTEVWCQGMSTWLPLKEFREKAKPEESLASADTDNPQPLTPTCLPWLRLLARAVDTIFLLFLSSCQLLVLPAWHEMNDLLFVLLIVGGACLLESLCLFLWAATPGKMLIGLKVQGSDGANLNFLQAAVRSAAMWLLGLGLFFSWALSLALFWASYRAMRCHGRTLWDGKGGQVIYLPQSHAQAAGLVLALLGGLQFINLA
jgi:uncharacterized RDD family membrane protein YckC